MAFNIILQKNLSEKICIRKNLVNIATLSGTLKEETSVIDPTITINANLSDLTQCNYFTIEAFGRSYIVNNIRSIRSGLVEISGHVDVLSSWKLQLLSNKGIIRRQEYKWNTYLNDGSFRVYSNSIVQTVDFPSGFDSPEFVLAVAGGNTP